MKQTVHNDFSIKQLFAFKTVAFTAVVCLLAVTAAAQTYTTKAAGNWNSATTWEGGLVPTTTIGAGMMVNVKHAVVFNLNSDLTISGTLNITMDTLRFPSSYDKKITVASAGKLSVKNAGLLQIISSNKCEMQVNGGRVILENAYLGISKNFKAQAGSKLTYKNSVVRIGDKYEMEGSNSNRTVDTVANSYLEVGINNGDLQIKDYCTLYVANATILAANGKFTNASNAEIKVLPNAAGNFGFDLLKAGDDLQNDGAWDARIDAYCVGKNIKGSNLSDIDFTRDADCNEIIQTGELPEMSFTNPVLKSGTANKEGAVYRFANVTTGVDAEIKLAKFSRTDIVMQSVDLSGLGWEKAFQPQFGLTGVVAPYQHWYIDFELTFYKAGTTTKQKLSKAVFTALDVDGDGWSISEYATFANPSSSEYSPVSVLGNGEVDILDPIADAGDLNTIVGTVQNFTNIDTAATQVMATFSYLNKDVIKFRYGARSGALSSNGSGMRLNSLWAKPFSLDPWLLLPVKFMSFNATLKEADAVLTWEAAQDQALSHFAIQRSTDGVTYNNIATVFAGTSTTYTYKDKNVNTATGIVYYRIVGVDQTKEANASAVKMIRLTRTGNASLAIATFPNPVANDLRITLPATWQGKAVTLEVYNATGVLTKTTQAATASQTETVTLSTLTKGLYVVKAICGAETATQRIVKN